MKNRHAVYRILCNYAIIFVGAGLFPILPFYAAQFGATPTVVGLSYAAGGGKGHDDVIGFQSRCVAIR